MKYALLLWPHANARYAVGMFAPAQAELDIILGRAGVRGECGYASIGGMDALTFTADALSERQAAHITRHSLAYGFGEIRPDGSLMPLSAKPRAYLGADLAGILKYKGKTNEQFTQHMINLALCAGDYFGQSALTLMDPMCGRGTTLFQAVNRGFNAIGGDIDKTDVRECLNFFKRYLEYHRLKHAPVSESRTLQCKRAVTISGYTYSDTPDGYKSGDTRSLTVCVADARDTALALKKRSVHIIACDLPYGVQHSPGSNSGIDETLARVLPAMHEALAPGGALALAFNSNTLRLERARELAARAGFAPLEGGAYDSLSHWVEQAVTRDVCVAVKRA